MDVFNGLDAPSENNPPVYYSSVDQNLYNSILMKYMVPQGTSTMTAMPGMSSQACRPVRQVRRPAHPRCRWICPACQCINMTHFIFGNITWSDLPHQWFTIGGTATIMIGGALVAGFITYKKRWTWLWKEWLTSTDPKKIGIMYIVMASLMLFRGGLDAAMIWLQQSISTGNSQGYLDSSHFQQIFTAHGDIMVFFVTMGFFFGLMNLDRAAADRRARPCVSIPQLAGLLALSSRARFSSICSSWSAVILPPAGWLSLPPLSELAYQPRHRRGLLDMELADLRPREPARRHQFYRHDH